VRKMLAASSQSGSKHMDREVVTGERGDGYKIDEVAKGKFSPDRRGTGAHGKRPLISVRGLL